MPDTDTFSGLCQVTYQRLYASVLYQSARAKAVSFAYLKELQFSLITENEDSPEKMTE